MRPLTDTLPKPLVSVCGKAILDHIVEALPPEITELILVVGYRADQIREHCGDRFRGRSVQYAYQENFAGGTGEALFQAKDLVHGKFLFMYADDIHGKEALSRVVKEAHAMLGMHSETPERYGVLVQNDDGTLKEILEKPEHAPSNLVNIGGFVVEKSIFDYVVPVSHLNELLVTDLLTAYAKDHPVKIIAQDFWLPIGYPEQIAEAEAVLCPKTN